MHVPAERVKWNVEDQYWIDCKQWSSLNYDFVADLIKFPFEKIRMCIFHKFREIKYIEYFVEVGNFIDTGVILSKIVIQQ